MKTKNKPIRIAITGGPCSGKSTLINSLAQRNYQTIPEASRIIIERESASNTDCLPWKNLQKFQNTLSQLQLDLENSINNGIIFSDRGIIDGHAYSKLDNIIVPQLIYNFGNNRYHQVFILETIPDYQTDSSRRESLEQAIKIHNRIKESYLEFGYNPINVPFLPPEQRTDFVLNHILTTERRCEMK